MAMTESEQWLQAYADEHGYTATFEADWEHLFAQPFATNPDFLLERDGGQAIVEVRSFASWALSEHLAKIRGGGTVPQAVTARPVFAAIKEKAAQLEPFASTGVPLVVALANPGGSDVILDEHHLYVAMFGDLVIKVLIARPAVVDPQPPTPHMEVQPGYCATASDGRPYNPRPHVSAVGDLPPRPPGCVEAGRPAPFHRAGRLNGRGRLRGACRTRSRMAGDANRTRGR